MNALKEMRMRALAHGIASVSVSVAVWLLYVFACHGCAFETSTVHEFSECFTEGAEAFVAFYFKELRGNLFAGYLTLGGFLLSLKTFIVVTMNDKLYEHPEYVKKWQESKTLDRNVGSLYLPLKKLSNLLFYAIAASLTAAGAQFSLGFIGHWLAVTLCLALAMYSFTLVVDCLWIIKANLDTWFQYIDRE